MLMSQMDIHGQALRTYVVKVLLNLLLWSGNITVIQTEEVEYLHDKR